MTTMTEQATQVYSVFIRATPEQVWDAITKPEFTTRYFHGTRIESTFEPGAPYLSLAGDGDETLVDGEVLESDPPRMLKHTWRALYDPETASEPFSRVTWEIEPQEGGVTKLTVIARPARSRAQDRSERRRRLELRAQRPEDAARDGRAASGLRPETTAGRAARGPPRRSKGAPWSSIT